MIAMNIQLLLLAFLQHVTISFGVASYDPWSIVVVADFHGAESFSRKTNLEKNYDYQTYLSTLSHMHETYGGEIMLLPGDTNSGKWFVSKYINKFFEGKTPAQAVYQAGLNCYSGLRKLFNEAGYNDTMMSLGDHEYGDNGWFKGERKTAVIEEYRQAFRDAFNSNQSDGTFLYKGSLQDGSREVATTPWGTTHQRLSYARQYKNVLFITIDLFEQISTNYNYLDKANGRGGEGTVTGTMKGDHLKWFENVLSIARGEKSSIKHIIVQAHLPVLEPVRKVSSSSMPVDDGAESDFWKMMAKYDVDLYLAGEVHSTTASKVENSNLVQIVSRGNKLNGFLKIQVESDDILRVSHYNEVGTKPRNNDNYEQTGSLVIDKAGNSTLIESHGTLELLDNKDMLIRFDFEEIVPMSSRQVIGLRQKVGKYDVGLIANSRKMRGISCNQSLPNQGKLGQQYDAQVANLNLREDIAVSGQKSAYFNGVWSRNSIYAMGPLSTQTTISFSLWIKTWQTQPMILVHYGAAWMGSAKYDNVRSSFSLILDNGIPKLYTRENTFLRPKGPKRLNDGNWHHIAVSMPSARCKLSEVELYIDGKIKLTHIPGNSIDEVLFFYSYGRLSLGGLGYSAKAYERLQPKWKFYQGSMDEFTLWGRALTSNDIALAMNKNFITYNQTTCDDKNVYYKFVKYLSTQYSECLESCKSSPKCFGFQSQILSNGFHQCTLYNNRPSKGVSKSNHICAIVV